MEHPCFDVEKNMEIAQLNAVIRDKPYLPFEVPATDPSEPVVISRACPVGCHGNTLCPDCAVKDTEIARLNAVIRAMAEDMIPRIEE
jgi:hypothetical protein